MKGNRSIKARAKMPTPFNTTAPFLLYTLPSIWQEGDLLLKIKPHKFFFQPVQEVRGPFQYSIGKVNACV
jgi:hypothetical protein